MKDETTRTIHPTRQFQAGPEIQCPAEFEVRPEIIMSDKFEVWPESGNLQIQCREFPGPVVQIVFRSRDG